MTVGTDADCDRVQADICSAYLVGQMLSCLGIRGLWPIPKANDKESHVAIHAILDFPRVLEEVEKGKASFEVQGNKHAACGAVDSQGIGARIDKVVDEHRDKLFAEVVTMLEKKI